MGPIDDWFDSARPIRIWNVDVQLRRHPIAPAPLSVSRGQGTTYWLDTNDATLIMKLFHPGQRPDKTYVEHAASCIPTIPQMRSGWERRVLHAADISPAQESYYSPELAAALDGAIVMPQLKGMSWGDFLISIADDGVEYDLSTRLELAWQLTEALVHLEWHQLSHRDLSAGNILIDPKRRELHVIDWDTCAHPSLRFQANSPAGSPGYTAPWAAREGRASWLPGADRYALAICIAEILVVNSSTSLHGDGSLFVQSDLGTRSPSFLRALSDLARITPRLDETLQRAWYASNFNACPAALIWLETIASVSDPRQLYRQDRLRQLREWESAIALLLQSDVALFDQTVFSALTHEYADFISTLPDNGRQIVTARRVETQRLAELRSALRAGDDHAIIRLAGDLSTVTRALRPSEVVHIRQATDREQAVAALHVELGRDSTNIQAIQDRWWKAIRLGSPLATELSKSILSRLFLLNSTKTSDSPLALDSSANIDVPPDRSEQDLSTDSNDSHHDERPKDSPSNTSNANESTIPTDPRMYDAWATTSDREEAVASFHQALAAGEKEKAAFSWARLHTLWPETLSDHDDALGRAMFLALGRNLRSARRLSETGPTR